ncbi:hypothetical protein LSAT2_023962 [Lamellibrachia satsuma]|nr:hypothetical protein LSAT2_023962 [Lamellibrachia satsuma]
MYATRLQLYVTRPQLLESRNKLRNCTNYSATNNRRRPADDTPRHQYVKHWLRRTRKQTIYSAVNITETDLQRRLRDGFTATST